IEGLKGSLSALLRRQFEARIPTVIRQREHFGEQCGVLLGGRGSRQDRIEFVEPLSGSVIVSESGGSFPLTNDRIKRAIGMLGRAKMAQPSMRLGCKAFE